MGLSLLFRIGLARHAKAVLSSGPSKVDKARRFIEQVAADWHLTRVVLSRASGAVTSWLTSPGAGRLPQGTLELKTTFDGIDLAIGFRCRKRVDGERRDPLSCLEPDPGAISDETACKAIFSPFVDRIKIHEEDESLWVTLFFDA